MAKTKRTRVDTREFDKLEEYTDPIIRQGIQDHTDYILRSKSPEPDDTEVIVRNTLEDVLNEIKEWFKSEYEFKDSDLRNFPELDDLIYHDDGWNLHEAILKHYEAYNKWRNKQNLINAIERIIATESIRLRNTVFDTLNERTERFKYVTIGGDACCEEDVNLCRPNYGTYRVGKDKYRLPPYHPGPYGSPICHCWAIYHDNPDIEIE